jgi:peroxiredoxin
LAEYSSLYEKFRETCAEVVGISVDDGARSEPLRREMKLKFPILCDTRREVITAWGLLNTRENGGIAFPAAFVIDRDRIVRFRAVEEMASRVDVAGLLSFIKGLAQGAGASIEPKRRGVWPGAMFIRATMNALRHGVRVPNK